MWGGAAMYGVGRGKEGDEVAAASGESLELYVAIDQVVERLLRDEPEEVARLRRLARLRDVPTREVRRADVEHFALLYERLHRLPNLVPRRVAIDVVHLVKIDVIGFQPMK